MQFNQLAMCAGFSSVNVQSTINQLHASENSFSSRITTHISSYLSFLVYVVLALVRLIALTDNQSFWSYLTIIVYTADADKLLVLVQSHQSVGWQMLHHYCLPV